MIVAPEYQFVVINEDIATIPDCYSGLVKCLPLYDLSDLAFQMVTNFQADPGEGTSRIVVVPCQSCGEYSDEEILGMAYGVQERLLTGSIEDDGYLKISTVSPFSGISVGDYVRLTSACNDGCTHNYEGTYEVLEITGGTQLTIDATYQGNIDPGEIVSVFLLSSDAYLFADSNFDIPDDSEFEGNNYVWNISHPANASAVINYAALQCFSLCVYRATEFGELTDVECLGMTNCFQKIDNTCYTSKVVYGCNENAFGFYADGSTPFSVSIRLPLYLHTPGFPGEEKGYQKSDGSFVKLAERVNKTWQLETDYLPDEIHARIRMMLSCDNIQISNENVNLVDTAIYRSEAYELAPNEEVKSHPFWKGSTTVLKKLLSRSLNSNCA